MTPHSEGTEHESMDAELAAGVEEQGVELAETQETPKTSRRGLLQMGAFGAAAIAGAAGVEALAAGSANAANGADLVIGNANATTNVATSLTELVGPGFEVVNSTTLGPAIWGYNSAGTSTSVGSVGVEGYGNIGVYGIAAGSSSTTSIAGVEGVSSIDGTPGVFAAHDALGPPLQLSLNATVPPTSSTFSTGSFMARSSDGALFYCYSGGTPGSWTQINNGFVPLPAPVRIISTPSGASNTGGVTGPLVPGSSQVYTTSSFLGVSGIPTWALGVCGNVAISGVSGALLNGYGVYVIYPAGASIPTAATINAGANCFALSNFVIVAFGTGANAGKLSMNWSGGGPVQNIQAYFDVVGYF